MGDVKNKLSEDDEPEEDSRDVLLDRSHKEQTDDGAKVPLWSQVLLVTMVIGFGCGNFVSRQMAAKTLERFDYILGLVSAFSYVVFYWLILGGQIFILGKKQELKEQLRWAWCGWNECCTGLVTRPILKLFAIAAIGDATGDVIGFIATPHVSGPVHALLAQCTTIFTATLSYLLLEKRYSAWQILILAVVILGAASGVLPNLYQEGANGSEPSMAFAIAFSCIFNAFAFISKELAFGSYKTYAKDHPEQASAKTLNIFIANSAESTLQLPFTLMLVPLAQVMGQTEHDNLLIFILEGFACLRGDTEYGEKCGHAKYATAFFIFCNLSWNISILLSIKWNGALATFVALKAILPCSAILFAYVDWPWLGRTPLKPTTWISLSVVVPCILLYTWAARRQEERQAEGKATCCYPLGRADSEDDLDSVTSEYHTDDE